MDKRKTEETYERWMKREEERRGEECVRDGSSRQVREQKNRGFVRQRLERGYFMHHMHLAWANRNTAQRK